MAPRFQLLRVHTGRRCYACFAALAGAGLQPPRKCARHARARVPAACRRLLLVTRPHGR